MLSKKELISNVLLILSAVAFVILGLYVNYQNIKEEIIEENVQLELPEKEMVNEDEWQVIESRGELGEPLFIQVSSFNKK